MNDNLKQDYCVAFLDILGFKYMTGQEKITETYRMLAGVIQKMKGFLKEYIEKNGRALDILDQVNMMQFADTIVLIFPKQPYISLYCFQAVSKLQFELAKEGIYLRGGINSGILYMDTIDNVYFGDAWNGAVKLEEEAKYPRVIIEKSICDMVKAWLQEVNESVLEFYEEDKIYMLPVLSDIFIQKSDSEKDYESIVENLERNVKEQENSKEVLKKYKWMAEKLLDNNTVQDNQNIKEHVLKVENDIKKFLEHDSTTL